MGGCFSKLSLRKVSMNIKYDKTLFHSRQWELTLFYMYLILIYLFIIYITYILINVTIITLKSNKNTISDFTWLGACFWI